MVRPGLIFLLLLTFACSKPESPVYTVISGTITVDPEFDDTPNFGGIHLQIVVARDDHPTDTLYHAVSNVDGYFNAVSKVYEPGLYPLAILRNRNLLYVANVVLAPDDTIQITGMLPDIENTLRVSSPENDAYVTLQRVQRNFNRIQAFMVTGGLSRDTIPDLMRSWSDIFWSMRENYPGTFASRLASIQAVELLDGWYDEIMLTRIDSLGSDDIYHPAKVLFGSTARVRLSGLEAGLEYLDLLEKSSRNLDQKISTRMRAIELMVESDEISRSADALRVFLNRKEHEPYQTWAKELLYELENLMPGSQFPHFEITLKNGAVFTPEGYLGKPFVLEVILVTDRNYQNSYSQVVTLYRFYKDSGVEFFSVPAEERQILVDAFFDERGEYWPVAVAGSFQKSNLAEVLQVEQAPTRFLVDRDGRLVGRYFGIGTSELMSDLEKLRLSLLN